MKNILDNLYKLVVGYFNKSVKKLKEESKVVVISYALNIMILFFIIILLLVTYSSFLKLLLGLLILVLILLFRKMYKSLHKEVEKSMKSLEYVLIGLIISNISIFIFFLLGFYYFNGNDVFGIEGTLTYFYQTIRLSLNSFIVRFGIVIATIYLYLHVRSITKEQQNKIESEYVREKVMPYLETLPGYGKGYQKYENDLMLFFIIFVLFMPKLLSLDESTVIIVIMKGIVLFIGIIFSTIFVLAFLFLIGIGINLTIIAYKDAYKSNPGEDGGKFMKNMDRNVQLPTVGIRKITKAIGIGIPILFGLYVGAETLHSKFGPDKTFPLNEKFKEAGEGITKVTGYDPGNYKKDKHRPAGD